MDLKRTVLGALAWAGLVFVIAVPSAEVVTSKVLHIGSAAEAVAPVAQPAKPKPVAAVVPADKPVPAKPSQPASTPAPASDPAVAEAAPAPPADPIKDYLADGKPLPDYLTTGKASAPVAAASPQPAPAALPRPADAVAATPAPKPAAARPKPTVTEADLKDWKSGTLEDYLRQKGLLNESTNPSAGN